MRIVIDNLIKILVNYRYKKYPFLAWSWRIDEYTDMNIISEESYLDRHRFGGREEYEKEIANGTPLDIKAENLCNSCTNMACEFQYGIERSSCALYMPPNAEPDNCGNYIGKEEE